MYISIYICIYILKKRIRVGHAFFCKRMLRSLRSLTFFAKECCVLCLLLGLISRQKIEKRMEKNGTFFLKNGKERNVPNGKECDAQPCPDPTFCVNTDLGLDPENLNLT